MRTLNICALPSNCCTVISGHCSDTTDCCKVHALLMINVSVRGQGHKAVYGMMRINKIAAVMIVWAVYRWMCSEAHI